MKEEKKKKEDLVWRTWNRYFRRIFPFLDCYTIEDLYQEVELLRLEIKKIKRKKDRVKYISRRFYCFLKARGWFRKKGGKWEKREYLYGEINQLWDKKENSI